ncbi:hypothetical protein [Stenotrophomonas maltophilia]|uniref:hypothetical protein n=1 Tax=Stenotrophomonas maltophilia TaxID=40324 RepID=UPI002158AFCE|nr:hypothetical protein [Stenotrophomonas maltophilia]
MIALMEAMNVVYQLRACVNASHVARSHERLTTIFRTVPELHASRTRDAGTAGKQIGERIGRPGGLTVRELHFRKRAIIGDEVAPQRRQHLLSEEHCCSRLHCS